ncbi:MAG: hypothetical protein HQK51_21040, partial [Oligoflexia bacterium]|nr:hypothetical protein [Oligoflexia bacterium]
MLMTFNFLNNVHIKTKLVTIILILVVVPMMIAGMTLYYKSKTGVET